MNLKHFGDSYDIVKKSLLQWLFRFGPWAAHPMFTHPVTESDAAAFASFLGVPLVSNKVLSRDCDRRDYLAACGNWRSILLDPDTGVRLNNRDANRSTEFLFSDELVALAEVRTQGLVLTFDQSLARGAEREQVQAKLDHFLSRGLDGFAYVSHASFLVLGKSSAVVHEARQDVLALSGLPPTRIIVATPPNQNDGADALRGGATARRGSSLGSSPGDTSRWRVGTIIERSLERFLAYVREHGWYGRENEAVSLYAFGFLQKECTSTGPFADATQIGIEVGAAPAPTKGANARVRKDLVIWPEPAMNCWFPNGASPNKPIAVVEWKVRRPDAQAPRGGERDFGWLTAHCGAHAECIGYSVELNLAAKPPSLAVMRFCEGQSEVVEFG